MAKKVGKLFKDVGFILKLMECSLCIVGVIMLADNNTSYGAWRSQDLISAAVIGCLILTLVFIVVIIIDGSHRLLAMIPFGIGGILSIAAGILCIMHYLDIRGLCGHGSSRNSLILGLTTLVCGILMIGDVVLMFFKK